MTDKPATANLGTYFEIPVTDLERAISFYSAVFQCQFERTEIHGNAMALFAYSDSASGISGALAQGPSYKPSLNGTLIYLTTVSIDETLRRALSQGGQELFPKTEVTGLGFSAEFQDSEGNRIALFEAL